MANHFYAMLHRMRYIRRWSLMRNSEPENLQEHSLEVSYLAHALALIRQSLDPLGPNPAPEFCVLLALYHDVSEIITGDLPTPIKYYNEKIFDSFREVEAEAIEVLLRGVPAAVRADYEALLKPDLTDPSTQVAYTIVKAADTLAAYLKCLEEKAMGNTEFLEAEKSILLKLQAYDLAELEWFMQHCLEAYSLTLDELRLTGET